MIQVVNTKNLLEPPIQTKNEVGTIKHIRGARMNGMAMTQSVAQRNEEGQIAPARALLLSVVSFAMLSASAAKAEENAEAKLVAADIPAAGAAVAQPPVPRGGEEAVERVKSHAGKMRLALTLAGGGSRGAAHIGVLKVLEKEGIKPDLITGSSIGAFIGSLYAGGLSATQIEEMALSGKLKKAFFPRPRLVQVMLYAPRYQVARMMCLKPKIGLYSGKSISRCIRESLPADVQNFEDLKIPLVVTSINLVDTKPVWISKGNIADAVRASNTVPFVYRTLGPKDGPQLVDGGIRENLPAEIADAADAPLVVAVKLHSYLEKVPREKFDTNFELADRVTSILMSEVENKGVTGADILIEPKVQFMTMHSFTKKELASAIAEGEKAAREALPAIKAQLSARTASN